MKDFRINPDETEREREIRVCQSPAGVTEHKGYCGCCGRNQTLLTDEVLGESICKICHSFDVRRAA